MPTVVMPVRNRQLPMMKAAATPAVQLGWP
jgi:hypothetical protein